MEESTKLKHLVVLILLIPAYAQDTGGPSIIFPNKAINVNEGDAVELPCGVKGEHRHCNWEHDGGAMVQVEDVLDEVNPLQGYDKPSNSTDNQCGIAIKEVTHADGGNWTCKIMVTGKALTQSLTLTVLDPTATRAPRNIDFEGDSAATPVSETNYHEDFNVTRVPDMDYHQDNDSTEDYYDYLNSLDSHFPSIEPRHGKGDDSDESSTPSAEPEPETEPESEPEPEPDHNTTQGHGTKYPQDPGLHTTTTYNHNYHPTDPHVHPHHTVSPAEKHVTENQVHTEAMRIRRTLWISLIVIIMLILVVGTCFWYFFCRGESHDIMQMEGGSESQGVEMSQIVQENGDLETIAEEHSSTQLLSDIKVEVHNEQELNATQGKEKDKGISNKAFTDQEEVNKHDDKPEEDQSDKSDQKDLSKEDNDDDADDKGATNENSEKNEVINDGNDSKSIESISSEGEKVEDKDLLDECDENKDCDNKDDDVTADKQTEDIKDDDKANDVEAIDKHQDDSFGDKAIQDDRAENATQDSPTPQANSSTTQQVEGEESPFQGAVFLNMHNGEVYEEGVKDKIDDDDIKKE